MRSTAYPSGTLAPTPVSTVSGTTYHRQASVVAADAITILSNSWSDANSNAALAAVTRQTPRSIPPLSRQCSHCFCSAPTRTGTRFTAAASKISRACWKTGTRAARGISPSTVHLRCSTTAMQATQHVAANRQLLQRPKPAMVFRFDLAEQQSAGLPRGVRLQPRPVEHTLTSMPFPKCSPCRLLHPCFLAA